MDPNHYTVLINHRAEYPARLAKSQQRRDYRQAAAAQSKRQHAHPVRAWMSAALIAAGERIQEKVTSEPTHAESLR